ncbi:hypothetical protein NQ314_019968 [Rhamnusium bicolor]|uniref:Uncharacterized protein n=1 Tax=Rhamnusium bicolor TaxID=1586634 RepID=A0AAV8WM27_9CUCU|nr:hypothetical protein NQ314_019968 [Rhamnusium bicolor]
MDPSDTICPAKYCLNRNKFPSSRKIIFAQKEVIFLKSTKQSVGVHQRKKDLRRLLLYLLYGWGMPTFLTLTIYLFSRSTFLPYSIRPYVGTSVCFIENSKLSLIVKLSVIMGVTYIFDVMSAFFDMSKMGVVPEYIEIIWDCINCLQGMK